MILDVNIVKENIGKKIRWSVEGYAGQNYGGYLRNRGHDRRTETFEDKGHRGR